MDKPETSATSWTQETGRKHNKKTHTKIKQKNSQINRKKKQKPKAKPRKTTKQSKKKTSTKHTNKLSKTQIPVLSEMIRSYKCFLHMNIAVSY
jgi:hypothetical protein